MQCTVIRNKENNNILAVQTLQGTDSKLYQDLLDIVQNEEEAVDLVYLSRTDEYRNRMGDWTKTPTMKEPEAVDVIAFDKENDYIRKQYAFNTGKQIILEQQRNFVEKTIKDLEAKINLYRGNSDYTKGIEEQLERVRFKQNIRDYTKADILNALVNIAQFNVKEFSRLEQVYNNIVQSTKDINGNDKTRWTQEQEAQLVNYLVDANLFLQGYARVSDMDTSAFENKDIDRLKKELNEVMIRFNKSKKGDESVIKMSEEEFTKETNAILNEFAEDDINERIKLVSDLLRDYRDKVDLMMHTHEQLTDEHLERMIAQHTTNPEIKHNIKEAIKGSQYDETRTQLLFDAMGDTHNPLVANLVKLFNINQYNKEKDIKQTTEKWVKSFNKIKALGKDTDKILDLIYHKVDGQRTGQLVTKYNPEFEEIFRDWNSRVFEAKLKFGETSDEYLRLNEEFKDWKRNNTVQEYDQRWIDLQNILTMDSRIARARLYNERNIITRPYIKKSSSGKEYYDMREMSDESRDRLHIINSELTLLAQDKEFKDGVLVEKTGKALEIALNIQKYNEQLKKLDIYEKETKVIPEFYTESKQLSGEELFEWQEYNTFTKITDEFFKLREGYEKFEIPEEIQKYNEELRYLKAPYNKEGDIFVHLIPKDVLARINELSEIVDNWYNSEEAKAWFKQQAETMQENSKMPDDLKYATMKPLTNYTKTLKRRVANNDEINTLFPITLDEHESLYLELIPVMNKFAGVPLRYSTYPKANYTYNEIKKEFKTGATTVDNQGKAIPTDKWISEEYKELEKNEAVKEFYDNFTTLLANLINHYGGSIISKGMIPAYTNEDVGNLAALQQMLGWYDIKPKEFVKTDMKDNIIQHIPLNFIRLLGEQKELYKIPKYNSELESGDTYIKRVLADFRTKIPDYPVESISDIREYIAKTKKENMLSHGKSISFNLEEFMPLFIKSALNHKYKSEIKNQLLLGREKLAHQQFKKTRAGVLLKRYQKGKEVNDMDIYTVSGENSNLLEHFDKWLEMVFYENFELDEGNWTKFARVLQNYTSLRGIGFNLTSGVNNITYGQIMMAIEMAGGYFYTRKDWSDAKKEYWTNVIHMIADTKKSNGEYSSKTSAWIKEVNIMESQDEKAESAGISKGFKLMHKLNMINNAAYIMQHLGEHNMQSQGLLSMSKSHRVIDGKIMSFVDFKSGQLKKINPYVKNDKEREEQNKAIEYNKELTKKLQTKFESYKTLFDTISFKDGTLDMSMISNEEMANFKQKVISVNQKIHGIYVKADLGTSQQRALWRLALQFRKWMPETLNKRFYGASWMKDKERFDWNERRGEEKEGMYVTVAKLLSMPYKELKKTNSVPLAAAKTLIEDLRAMFGKHNLYYHSLSETQKANIRRFGAELASMGMIMVILQLVKLLGGDLDDEDKKRHSYFYNGLLYQLDRTRTELLLFNPTGSGIINEAKKMMNSPAASVTAIEQIIKVVSLLLSYPFMDEDEKVYKGGRYHGYNKLVIEGINAVPFVNQGLRLWNLRNHVNYFKLAKV